MQTLTPIESGKSYQLDSFKKLTGLGDHAMRSARRKCSELGITLVRRLHGRAFVRGDDWLTYLEAATREA
jgi:hypothetical protein